MDSREIQKFLPHRYPFLLVDRILEVDPDGGRVLAAKMVSMNEPYFTGHFPGNPIMPGVLIVEALAQAGAFLVNSSGEPGQLALLAGIDNARFRQPVRPGETLILDVSLTRMRGHIGKVRGIARVDESIVAECDIIFAIVPEDAEGG